MNSRIPPYPFRASSSRRHPALLSHLRIPFSLFPVLHGEIRSLGSGPPSFRPSPIRRPPASGFATRLKPPESRTIFQSHRAPAVLSLSTRLQNQKREAFESEMAE